jgi:prolyl-tRNA editing enzyme YbaK/EbsC (Cys-tRNA(Pro) deacylase)
MTHELPPSAQRVQQALRDAGSQARVIVLDVSTRTADDAAAAVGCDVGQIVKSLIFSDAQGAPVYVAVSGKNRLDEQVFAQQTYIQLKRATPDFVRQHTGYAIGGVAPFGHVSAMPHFIDATLLEYPTIWAAGGTPNTMVELTGAELVALTAGVVVRVS